MASQVKFRRIGGRIVPIRQRAGEVAGGAAIGGIALAVKSDSIVGKIQNKINSMEADRPFKSARSERLLNSAFRKKYSGAMKRAATPLIRLTNNTKSSFYSPWQHSVLVKGRNYGAALHELGHAEAITKRALSHKLPDALAKPFWDLGDKFKTGSIPKNLSYKAANFAQEIGIIGAESDAWRRAFKSKVPLPIKKQMLRGAALGVSAYAASPAVRLGKLALVGLGASLIYKGLKSRGKK